MRKISIGLLIVVVASGCFRSNGDSDRPGDAVVRGVNYIGMTVTNLSKSASFYSESAGLESVEQGSMQSVPLFSQLTEQGHSNFEFQLLRSSNAQVRLMRFQSPSDQAKAAGRLEVYGPGIAHVCYQVDQKTRTYQRFLERGATAIGSPELVQISSSRPVYYGYARDLDESIFEVEHVDIEALDLETPPKHDYRIRHVSLATTDFGRAVDFYSKLLQEDKPRRAGRWFALRGDKLDQVSGLSGSKIRMAWFQIRNLELEIIQYISHSAAPHDTSRPVDAPGYNMIVFDITDLDAARERLLAAGGRIVSDVNQMDGGDILFGRDPDGNLLGFQRIADSSIYSSQNFEDNGI